jgi:hypothetical protein
MNVAVAAPDAELERLYRRFKALSLAVSAALVLDRPLGELAGETDALVAECLAAAADAEDADSPLVECVGAALALSSLVQRASAGESTDLELAQLRAAHLRLRRDVWAVLPCEYVPCCCTSHATHQRGE